MSTDLPDHRLRWVLRAAVAVLVVSVAVFVIRGADTTARPKVDTNGARPSRVTGFDQIRFAVRAANGATSRHCALLALTQAQQDRGLMNRRDLAGYDGMVFQFVDPTTTQFYMKDTLINLSIAWFDAGGRFVSSTDMTPCGSAAVCPLYHAAAPYTVALEVAGGQLGQLGVGPGAILSVGGAC
ncbi:MAG: DUF192 domain-containing protein [Actinomycetota bacterium]|nr:DUF192 domain-containing protein [Actinomycetota bacterium]